MLEIICAFLWAESWDEGADFVLETANGSLGGLAQKDFEFGKGRLDRIEVGRIARQVTQPRTRGSDSFAHTSHLP